MNALLLLGIAVAGDEPPYVLAAGGEALPGAVVERVDTHPEYQRYWLRYPDGALVPAEITTSRDGYEGLCAAHDVTLYARVEMAEGTVPADVLAPMRALCERLEDRAPEFRPIAGPEPVEADAVEAEGTRFYPLHVAILAWLGALVAAAAGPAWGALRRLAPGERAELAAVTLIGVAARVALSPMGAFNGGGAAWEKLVLAWGTDDASPYGDGWPALMGPVLAVFGRAPDVVFAADRVWACFAPPLLWAATRLAVGDARPWGRRAALAAGLAMALLPLHIRLSATEAMHIPVVTLEVLSVAAALGATRAGGLGLAVLSALSAGLAANTRPEALAFLGVPAFVLVSGRVRGRWVAVAILAALAAARIGGSVQQPAGILRFDAFLRPGFWIDVVRPRLGAPGVESSFSVFLHGGLTPPVLWAFALAGFALAPRRVSVLFAVWWACTELPVVGKVYPIADALRLQSVSQPAWLLLVGVGAGGIGAALGRWAAAVPWALAGSLAIGLVRDPPALDWAHQREYRFLATEAAKLDAHDVVVYADEGHRGIKVGLVLEQIGPARWVPASMWHDEGATLVYLGLSCAGEGAAACAAIRDRCALVPLDETTLGPPADLDLKLPPGGVTVGLYRVTSCG